MSITPLIVSLEGELDIAERDRLEWNLKPAQFAEALVIDLSQVGYIDSSCLAVLVRLRKLRMEKGFPPAVLVISSKQILKIFQLTQLDALWDIYGTLEEAMAGFSPPQAAEMS